MRVIPGRNLELGVFQYALRRGYLCGTAGLPLGCDGGFGDAAQRCILLRRHCWPSAVPAYGWLAGVPFGFTEKFQCDFIHKAAMPAAAT